MGSYKLINLLNHTPACSMLLFIITLSFFNTLSHASNFTQTDWSGGDTTANATFPTDQTGWNNYSKKTPSTLITNGGSGLEIETVADTITHNVTNFSSYSSRTNVMVTDSNISLGINFNPSALGLYSSPSRMLSVHVSGNYAFAADDSGNSSSRFRIIDIADPDTPALSAETSHASRVYDAYVLGNYAYVAVTAQGLAIVDISNPLSPVTVQTVDTPGWAVRVHVVGNYAYVADWSGGLQIIDISTPATAFIVGSATTPSNANDIFVLGNYAYITTNIGLQIFNITDQANPLFIASYLDTGSRIAVAGNFAYLVGSGLKILDISDPENPQLASSFSDITSGSSIHVAGEHAYVSDSGQLKIIDISNPYSPSLISAFVTLHNANDIQVIGKYAYIANGIGMQVISLGDYETNGTYSSSILDAGEHVGFSTFDYSATIPANTTLPISIRSGNTPAPENGGWTTWQIITTSGEDISSHGTNRYMQYKIDFTSADARVSPTLDNISINYSRYVFFTTLTSSAFNTVEAGNLLDVISWNETLLAGTDVRIQIRSAPNNAGLPGTWSDWQGPDGTLVSYWNSANTFSGNCSGSGIVTCINWPNTLRDGIDDQWLQYQIILISSGNNTSTLSEVTLNYATGTTSGITITPTTHTTSESTLLASTFTVSLSSAPSSDVMFALYSTDLSEGSVTPSNLTFTPTDWADKTVTITPINDDVNDGNITYSIITSATTSSDSNYHNVNPSDVSVTNNDDDSANIEVSPSVGLTTTESGDMATFDIRLSSQPLADVTIPLSSSDNAEGTISVTQLIFTPVNWNSFQAVTVTGIDDGFIDGDIGYTIITAAASSSDPAYNGLNATNITLSNIDDDTATVIVSPPGRLLVSEYGGIAPYSLVLSSEPTSNVTFTLSSNDLSEGTIFEWSMTFTPSNWNIPQTSAVYGRNDQETDGDIDFNIVIGTIISSDNNYSGLDPADIPVTNIDDDGYTITVTPTSGLMTTEDGGKAFFTIKLGTQPSSDVTILLTSSDPTEGITPVSVTLKPSDVSWRGQTVIIEGLHDDEFDGDQPYTIITSAAISSDAGFNGINPDDVSVVNQGNNLTATLLESNQTTYRSGGTNLYVNYGGANALASAGDVNGDGYPDLIVGAERYGPGSSPRGQAFVYHGSATGYSNIPDWISAEAINTNAKVGTSVAAAGDVNGDGYDDVIVGASWYQNGEIREGGAFLYYGSASGLSTSSDWTAESDQAYAFFGTMVNAAGDVNGDGYDDIMVGAWLYDVPGFSASGRAYLYYGSANGPSTTADWITDGNNGSMYYGESLASAGDVNNDGFDDIIVGGVNYTNGETQEGTARLFYGSSGGPSLIPDWTYESDQNFARLGSSVNSAGDVNGDGYMDVIIGAIGYDNTLWEEGRAYVFHGSADGLSLTPDWIIDGLQGGANLGDALASVGDINNDGYGDVIVGMQNYDTTRRLNAGRAEIYFGSVSGLATTPGWVRDGTQLGGNFGSSVTMIGDINQDGYSDFAVGSSRHDNGQTDEGVVFVYITEKPIIPRDVITSPSSGLTTTETGSTTTFTVTLSYAPTANVTIPITTDDASEGEASPASLTFTPQNWYVAQTVSIAGVDDTLGDGDIPYNVIFGTISSGDSAYSGTVPNAIPVTNVDNERIVSITATDNMASEAGQNEGIFTVSHAGFKHLALTVNYAVSGTASSGFDFQALTGSVTIPIGYSSTTIMITPFDDNIVEGNETITLNLTSGGGYVVGAPGSDTVALGDDDSANVLISPTTGLTTSEAGGVSTFNAILTSKPSGNVNVHLQSNDTSEGVLTTNQLVFTPSNWSTAQSVTISGVNDDINDDDVSYLILTSTTSSDPNYGSINPSDVSVINQDDDTTGNSNIKIGALTSNIVENSNTPGIFRLSRSGEVTSSLTVNFSLSGSATANVDYNALGSTATFPAGSKHINVIVTSKDDALFESDETIIIALQSGNNYLVDRPSAATMKILDDEQPTLPSVNFTIDRIIEEGSTFTLTANLSKEALVYPVTIPYTVSGSALNASDHNATNGSLVITSEQTGNVTFTTVNDGPNEADETVIFTMGTPTNGVVGVRNTHTVTITELNVMPAVSLVSAQNGIDARIIVSTAGEVTITASVTDANISDAHSYDWALTNNNLIDTDSDGDPATFVFNPGSLLAGYYKIVLSVDDDGSPSMSATVEMLIEVVDSAPILTTNDSDGDGISDDLESYDDSDGDGIADYLDAAYLTRNQLQAVDGVSGNYIIETELGLSLRLGEVAFAATADGAEVSLDEITDFGGGEGTPGVDPNDGVANTGGYFDYEIWGLPQAGQSAMLVIPQFNAIPNNAIYRKYFGTAGWQNFVIDSFNNLASSAGTPGACPPPGDSSYTPGLTEGHFCIQLTIQDGGPNDTDSIANLVIADPGTLSITMFNTTRQNETGSTATTDVSDSNGGGTINIGLLILLLVLVLLQANSLRRQRK